MKHTYSFFSAQSAKLLAMIAGSTAMAFLFGIQTAGDIHPIAPTKADGTIIAGDINGDGSIDIDDAIAVIDIVTHKHGATADEMAHEITGDGLLNLDDARQILLLISTR